MEATQVSGARCDGFLLWLSSCYKSVSLSLDLRSLARSRKTSQITSISLFALEHSATQEHATPTSSTCRRTAPSPRTSGNTDCSSGEAMVAGRTSSYVYISAHSHKMFELTLRRSHSRTLCSPTRENWCLIKSRCTVSVYVLSASHYWAGIAEWKVVTS